MLDSLKRGGGEIVETALAEVAADYATSSLTADPESAEPPRVPAPRLPAAQLGADNRRVRELIEARLAAC